MDQHPLGQKVRLSAAHDERDCPIASVNRVEVTRPDGTHIDRDWDKCDMIVKVTQLGIWSWRMYIREDGSTRMVTGQFEVVATAEMSDEVEGKRGWIRALRGRVRSQNILDIRTVHDRGPSSSAPLSPTTERGSRCDRTGQPDADRERGDR